MTEQQFDQVIEQTLSTIKQLLIVKGKEYRRNANVFHNFEAGAKKTGKIREEIIQDFALKHIISIDDMREDIKKGILPKLSTIEEKFNDALVYTLLEKASIVDRVNSKEVSPEPMTKQQVQEKWNLINRVIKENQDKSFLTSHID